MGELSEGGVKGGAGGVNVPASASELMSEVHRCGKAMADEPATIKPMADYAKIVTRSHEETLRRLEVRSRRAVCRQEEARAEMMEFDLAMAKRDREAGVEGSWKWACRQMAAGLMVRRSTDTGSCRYRLDLEGQRRIQWCFSPDAPRSEWDNAYIFLGDFECMDWEVCCDR